MKTSLFSAQLLILILASFLVVTTNGDAVSKYEGDHLTIFSEIAKNETKGVVNVSTKRTVTSRGFSSNNEKLQEHFNELFPWHKSEPHSKESRSLGSGFIVDESGYILTNYHVIKGADEIVVTFGSDKKHEIPAKLIGADPKIDIALIKIETKNKLHTLKFGDSDKITVGEWVMAIGNPFGFQGSVTVGVVSAKGRDIGSGPYDSFIQTDAAINVGNSGGPLLNSDGEVVGINSAIFTSGMSQGSIGIGFAIPINLVKNIYADLKKGKVLRGWIGVHIQEVNEKIKEAFDLPFDYGALVGNVVDGSPADKSKLQQGDIILEFEGKKIDKFDTLPRLVGSMKPGDVVKLKIYRNKKFITKKIVLEDLPSEDPISIRSDKKSKDKLKSALGVTVEDLSEKQKKELGVTTGVLATDIIPNSPMSAAGVRVGDIILKYNNKPVGSTKEFHTLIGASKKKKHIALLVKRGSVSMFLIVEGDQKKK
ncbi:MAG: Do family serine endopeptidase [Nitrospinota bacterium]